MHLGFVQGKPIVAYRSVEEAIDRKSCLTCKKYTDKVPCVVYGDCRAEKPSWALPRFYIQANMEVINSRLTTIEGDIQWI